MTGFTEFEALACLGLPVRVTGGDYSYDGKLCCVFTKSTGARRVIVEDGNRRLFIHNPDQVEILDPADPPAAPGARVAAAARHLLDAITFDDCGAMIAGRWQGGNGGMISRGTITAADDLRRALEAEPARRQA